MMRRAHSKAVFAPSLLTRAPREICADTLAQQDQNQVQAIKHEKQKSPAHG